MLHSVTDIIADRDQLRQQDRPGLGGSHTTGRIRADRYENEEAKTYQGFMLAVLSLLPAVSLIHFWILLCKADLVTTKNPPRLLSSIWDFSELTSLDDPARICNVLHREPSLSCDGNITILPGLEPTLFAVVTLAAAIATFRFWRRVFG
jgi:hypothetical protein